MTVVETTLATNFSEPSLGVRVATRVLKLVLRPRANPDFEDAYYKVVKWWVEVDPTGMPQRELGCDAAGEALVAGPFGRNMGFWTDSHMVFDFRDYKLVPLDEFESAWSSFESSHGEAGESG
jgi:hypothetical protein